MKSRTTAGILALLLGGIGVHRFYLGQSGLGLLYLIFCWTFVPAFIAFIDALIFLTMSEDAFNAKYNKKFANSQNSTHQTNNQTIVVNLPGVSYTGTPEKELEGKRDEPKEV